MKNEMIMFTAEQGNLLIRLLLAHIISDFVLQSDKMVQSKKWFSKYMLLHTGIIFITTFIFTWSWKLSLAIMVLHWLIDSVKSTIQEKNIYKQSTLFIADQLFHIACIILLWFWYTGMTDTLLKAVTLPFTNYKFSMLLLAYAWLCFPVAYLIKFATQNIIHQKVRSDTMTEQSVEHGGKLIGQFERIIILTLVLFNQYEAIGFLITGKSIIRFSENSNLRSEYVLVGTMISYAIAILTGVTVNYLFSIY